MKRWPILMTFLTATAVSGQGFTAQFPLHALHFSTFGGSPYFTLNPGHRLILQGEEDGRPIELTITVLNQTKSITLSAGGVDRHLVARVIEEREVIDGALTEVGRYWYARALETGDIYSLGEEVDFYADGRIVGQAQVWQAGVDGALPGMVMPGTFLLGARYYQNQAPAALDGAENLAMGVLMTTPAGEFSNCVQILETDFLRPEPGTAVKTYAPGVGVVNDDDLLRLTAIRLGAVGLPVGAKFVPSSNHPWFPVSPGYRLVLTGTEANPAVVLVNTVLDTVREVPVTLAGERVSVPTQVLEARRTIGGELVDVTRTLVAQCLETSDVHVFGQEVDRYEGGVIVGHEGSWLAGAAGAEAGILMPGNLVVGARYDQGIVPGVGTLEGLTAATGLTVTTLFGTFTNCVQITCTHLVGATSEARERLYAPGVGWISDRNVLTLSELDIPGLTNGAPTLAIQEALFLSWPISHSPYRLEGSTNLEQWIPVQEPVWFWDGRNQTAIPHDRPHSYFRLAVP